MSSDYVRPRAFCATCDGLGVTSSRLGTSLSTYPTPCATCDGEGMVDRARPCCYACGMTGQVWVVGLGFVPCRSCAGLELERADGDAPPPDWIVVSIVLACAAITVALVGACTWSALCRGWIS